MKNLVALTAAVAMAIGLTSAALAAENLPPIQKVEIGANRQFIVNGKPFFPIMSWAQNARNYSILKEVGINTHAGSGDPAAAAASGAYVVTDYKAAWAGNDHVLAWIHGDEPDMPAKGSKSPRTAPEVLVAKYKEIKAAEPTRPVFVTFTGSFSKEESKGGDVKAYTQYAEGADALGFDIYPIYGSGFPTHLNWVGSAVAQLHTIAGPKRPVYTWIETSKGSQWMTYEKQPDVLPMHTRNEVWQAVINGATAIGYFTHVWKPAFKEFGATQDMQNELKRLDAQLTVLAPAILADPASAKITMKLGDDFTCQLKATQLNGDTFIFALNEDLGPQGDNGQQFDPIHPRQAKATFTVPGLKAGTAIEVVDENRGIAARNGTFSDDFAPLAEHIYKLKL